MIARFAIATGLAVLVTIGVLFTMQVLIAQPQAKLDESGTKHFVDFVRVQREESVQRTERRREKPMAPDAPPQQSAQPRVDALNETQVSVSIPTAPLDVGVAMAITGLGLAASDGEYLPIVKIAPIYPAAAQSRGIEGSCLVEYTVTTAGTVRDVKVLEATPAGIFNKVSIAAAKKFKYRPRVVDGEPIEVYGVRNLFRYELER
ncbi:MAG: TonB family protein [Candidatus Krumholzibacteria bacterium]|nr:TonB family protein [Candidatus Krumholzibacteria bacterium]